MVIKQNRNSSLIFSSGNRKNFFNNRLISQIKRRLIIFINRYRHYSKKQFKVKSYYHRRLRVTFINRICYHRITIPFIRFNNLRILANKSYRLRNKAIEILNSIDRFDKSSRNFSWKVVNVTRSRFNNRLVLWFFVQQTIVSKPFSYHFRLFWNAYRRMVKLHGYGERKYSRLRCIFQNIFGHLIDGQLPRLRKSKPFRFHQLITKLRRLELVCQKRSVKKIQIKFYHILFKFIKRFNKFGVLERYISTLLTKFAVSGWARFKKVQLKLNKYPRYWKAKSNLLKTRTKCYLDGPITINKIYDNLFSVLLYKGLAFHSLKYSSFRVYRKFLTHFVRMSLIYKLRGRKFREQGALYYQRHRLANQIKRVKFFVKQIRYRRYRLMVVKALRSFTANFNKFKHRRYLFSFLQSFLLNRSNLVTNIKSTVTEFKRLRHFVFSDKCSGISKLKYYKKFYLVCYTKSKLNNSCSTSSSVIIKNRTGLRIVSDLTNNYLFNVISSNIRSLRLISVVNGINQQLLATAPNFFTYHQIVTRRYLKGMRSLLISSGLKLSHLRFLSNYYKFYSFCIFLRPLINQAYYSQVNNSGLIIINQNLNSLSEKGLVKFGTETYTNLEIEFDDVTPFFNLNDLKTNVTNSGEVEEIPTTFIYSTEILKSARHLKEVKINHLQLLGLLLSSLISSGKKKKAICIFVSLIGLMKFKYRLDYLNEYIRFLSLLRPILRYRSMYIGGKKYKIPLLLTPDRGYRVAIRWYVNNSVNAGHSVNELFENFNKTLNNQGNLLKIRREHHLISFENKSYIRFLRFFKQGF